MKRTLCLLFVFILALSLCACKKDGGEQPTASDEPTTWGLGSAELPDIGKFDARNPPRMFDEYVDNLIPRSDYGELVPYLGATRDYYYSVYYGVAEDSVDKTGTFAETNGVYGLCKKDGTIVTDAVYSSIEYCDGYYLLKKATVDTDYELDAFRGNFYVIPKDGSSIFAFEKNVYVEYYGSGVFHAVYDYDKRNEKYFSANGELILDNSDGMKFLTLFVNGIARFNDGETTCLVDTSMKKLLTVPDAEILSDSGYFSVRTANGKYKIYKGITPVSDEEYDYVALTEDGYFAGKNGTQITILDGSMKKVSEFSVPSSAGYIDILSKDVIDCDGKYYITSDGKTLSYKNLSYFPDCDIYADWNYAKKYMTLLSSNFEKLYTSPEGLYPWFNSSRGKYIGFARFIGSDNGEGYEYFLMDTTDGKLIENIGIIDDFDGYSKVAADGRHRELFSAKDGSTLLTYSTFAAAQNTSVGTLYFYDLDGYAITADENFNIICRVPLSMEY